MPRIVSNFKFESNEPIEERDRFLTHNEMIRYNKNYIDDGHISFCAEDRLHYYYDGRSGEWKKLVDIGIREMNADDLTDCWWTLFHDADTDGSNSDYNDFLYGR